MSRTDWHARPLAETFATLAASEAGLSTAEAAQRRTRHGPNTLTRRAGTSWLRKLLEQFAQPLIVVLIAAAVVSSLLGDHVDAIVIAAVVLVNGVLGFVQEHRAEQAIQALGRTLTTEATALRDGALRRIPSADLVPGDVVALQSGDTVPADLRLFAVKDLQIEEAALTGESVAVHKALDVLPPTTPLGDRSNLAFAGSLVTYGQGRGVVVATGDHTETGRIAGLMERTQQLVTPLVARIAQLSRILVWSILATAAVLFAIEALRGRDLVDTFNGAVALAVGAIPEGLPAAVTVLLAVGVAAMARRRAVIRRLPAVETLGSTTVICSDKTGTLTENQMTVTALWCGGRRVDVSGVGLDPVGEFTQGGERLPPASQPDLFECLRAGALCNDARRITDGSTARIEGDPTEGALLVAAAKAGLDERALSAWPRLDVVPFESQHMYMATLHRVDALATMYVKGSSDVLLARCPTQLGSDGRVVPCDAATVHRAVDGLAAQGLRLLVLARKDLPPDTRSIGHGDVRDLMLLGLVGMIDPPRPAAARAVATCRSAGIQVKMITGDHRVTAAAIADQLGLEGARTDDGRLRAVTGQELTATPEADLPSLAEQVAVFARVAPEQKLMLVRALQSRGHVVAMTGDGVNDAPALKQADIGIAMGRGGTDVARAAAAMILTDDDFATIEAAVEEGRGVYDNLVKFVAWTLPTNGGEAVVLMTAMLFGTELPVLPVQLLWVNLGTATLLGISLVFEPKEPGLMQRPPRKVGAPILDRQLVVRILLVSALIGGATFAMFELAQHLELTAEQARTVAVNTIVVGEVGFLFACRSLRLPIWRIGVFSNRKVWLGALLMLLVQVAFTYLPVMNTLLHSAAIGPWWWLLFSGFGLLVFLLAEAKKALVHDNTP